MKEFNYIWYEPRNFFGRVRKATGIDVKLPEYMNLHTEFGAFLRRELIKGRTMALPHLGSIRIIGTKAYMGQGVDSTEHNFDTLYIDWAKTYKLWEEKPELKTKEFIRHTNENSGNIIYRVIYAAYPTGSGIWKLFKPKSNPKLGRAIKEGVENRTLHNIDVYDKARRGKLIYVNKDERPDL